MRSAGGSAEIRKRQAAFRPEKFDAPSPLAEFGLDRPPMSWQYVEIPDAAEE